jgi:hypothetical protein
MVNLAGRTRRGVSNPVTSEVCYILRSSDHGSRDGAYRDVATPISAYIGHDLVTYID